MSKTKYRNRPNCFVVVSYEGCMFPDFCQAPHYIVDCELHGTLGKVHNEETARGIMALHKTDPTWPEHPLPVTEGAIERIHAARTGQGGRIFVP